jgi:hypothetical protein
MVKITVGISTARRRVINSRDNGRNMHVNDQTRCGWPISATHDLNGQNFDEFSLENQRYSTPRLTC